MMAMARFLRIVVILGTLLLLQVIYNTQVDWRKLPSSFAVPSLDENATTETLASNTTKTCWWQPLATQASRVWQPHSLNYSWCIPDHSRYHMQHFVKKARNVVKSKQVDGIIFVKNPKAASSTGAGVSLRIANQVGTRLYNTSCSVNYTHPFAFFRGHAKRSPTSSLLWTILREPAKRQLSIYNFFFISRKGLNNATLQTIMEFLETHKSGQFRYIATRKWRASSLARKSLEQQQALVRNLLQHYHFIAISERMDESMVAMKMIFGLQHSDLIVLPSKVGLISKHVKSYQK